MTKLTLPMVAEERSKFEKCVYCPKLCRATCPVSNAEPNETLTPWGKMSSIYFAGRGDTAVTEELASLAWACTDCGACTSRCDHKNPVGSVLESMRAPMHELGVAPEEAEGVLARGASRRARSAANIAKLRDRVGAGSQPGASTKLLLGCGYTLHHLDVAEQAVRVVSTLVGGPVEILDGCCGAPERMAGDTRAARSLVNALPPGGRTVVLDPTCARSLRNAGREDVELVVDLAAASLEKFQRAPGGALRYHDPCALGRGLGKFDEPRRLIEKVRGEAALEFERRRENADCSGGGGLVPIVRPATSRGIARERLEQHERSIDGQGSTIVTACAGSLKRFRRSGANAVDLVTLLAEGLGVADASPAPDASADPSHA